MASCPSFLAQALVSEVNDFLLASAETPSLELLWPISIDRSSPTRKAKARDISIDTQVDSHLAVVSFEGFFPD